MQPERVSWPRFRQAWPTIWKPGEHTTIIGPTGSGKTTLAIELLDPMPWVVGLISKPRDKTIKRMVKDRGYKIVTDWPPDRETRKTLLWPKLDRPEKIANQRYQFDRALREIYGEGNQTVWLNETRYLADMLKMKALLNLYWTQARSLGLSILAEAQRPAWIPLEAYSQAQHLFLYKTGDERDIVRLGSLNGADARMIAGIVGTLRKHEWLYVHTNTRRMVVSKVDLQQTVPVNT